MTRVLNSRTAAFSGALGAFLFALLLICPKAAYAEDEAAPTEEDSAPVDVQSDYKGVDLSGGGEPPPQPAPTAGLQAITWPGFRTKDKRAEVFLQMTGPAKYRKHQRKNTLSFTLEGVEVKLKTNLLALDTRHFPGPVERFQLVPLPKNRARLDISLSKMMRPQIETRAVGGFTYMVVSFPITKEKKTTEPVASFSDEEERRQRAEEDAERGETRAGDSFNNGVERD